MKIRYLGNSGLKVSELCMGTMTFGGVGSFGEIGKVDLPMAKELVDTAIDAGINFFDTADVYSFGESEKILGKALGKKRNNAVICTKVRFNRGSDNPNDEGASSYNIIKGCEESLKRLGTDYIDIYMLHGYDNNTPIDETLKALDYLVWQGKVRYIGCSNFFSWQIMKALGTSEIIGLEKFIVSQAYYSLMARELEYEHIPVCQDQGIGLMIWSPLSGGFLTGKFRKDSDLPEGSRIGDNKKSAFIPPMDRQKGFLIIEELEKIAKNHDATIPQVAINYIVNKPVVSSVILGIRKKEQLIDNLGAVEFKMTEPELKRLDEVSKPYDYYPYWHHILTGVITE